MKARKPLAGTALLVAAAAASSMAARAMPALAAAAEAAARTPPSAAARARPLPLPPGAAPGRVTPEVACAAAPQRAYALYQPARYRPDRSWPVVYALDSRRQAAELVELVRPAAERFGWVVVSPLGTANVEAPEENAARLRAAWVDSHDRLALDDRRVYALGFSGMVRLLVNLAVVAPDTFAGIVALNGGLPLGLPRGAEPPLPFFGVVGERDFNYYEMLDVEARLAAAGVPQRLEIVAGSHEWPPAAVVGRAFGWLELQGMRERRRAHDPELVAALWAEELELARARDAASDLLGAERAWRGMATAFAGLHDTTVAAAHQAELVARPEFVEARRADDRRLQRDRTYLERDPALLHGAWGDSPEVAPLLAALDVPALQRRAKADPDPAERLSAERLLYAVYIQAALYLPRTFNDAGEHRRALFYLQVAAAIDPEVPHVPYRQAVTWALLGNRREALRALERAVELGWDSPAVAEEEPAFGELRADPRFAALVERMRRPRAAGRRQRRRWKAAAL